MMMRERKMKYLVILTVIVGVVFDPLTLRAEAKDTDTIVEVYNGSTNLPDWAAYKTFLINVQGHGRENGHSDHYLGRVFSIDPNSADGLTKIEAYRELFDQSGSEIERQLDSVSDRIFCSGDWRAMSFDEVVDGLEERRAFRERTYEEHLEASMSLLDDEDRSAFLAYLVEIKKRTSYTRHDNRR
jgi:hypothetical protein